MRKHDEVLMFPVAWFTDTCCCETLTWSATLGFPPSLRYFSTTGSLFSMAAVRNICSSTVSTWGVYATTLGQFYFKQNKCRTMRWLGSKQVSEEDILPQSQALAVVSYEQESSSPSSSSSAAGCWTGRPPSPTSACRFYPSDIMEKRQRTSTKTVSSCASAYSMDPDTCQYISF